MTDPLDLDAIERDLDEQPEGCITKDRVRALVARVRELTDERDGSQFLKNCAEAALNKAEARVRELETELREIVRNKIEERWEPRE